jgi:hypothetical protein
MSRHERLCALLGHSKHVKRRDVRAILNESTNDNDDNASSLDLNAVDSNGWPPLAIASRRGLADVCKLLIRHGASLESCTLPARNTATHVAAIFGRAEVLFVLQRAARRQGIDVMNDVVNRDRLTAAQLRDQAESKQRRADSARRHAKRSRTDQAQMRESESEDEAWWREKWMAESHMADDAAAGDWREAAFDNHGGGAKSSVDAMNDDQYAAHIREQMRRRQDASAGRATADDVRRERAAKRDAERRAEAEREARQRLDELEATERDARAKKRRVARAAEFEEQWSAFVARVASSLGDAKLRLRDIPWPCDADVYELAEADEARGGRVALLEERLQEHFGGVLASGETARQTLRTQLLRWHPDKFSQKFGRVLDARDADLVLARVKLIAQCLTQMLSRIGTAT